MDKEAAPTSQGSQFWRVDGHVFIRQADKWSQESMRARDWIEDERTLPREDEVRRGCCRQSIAKQGKGAFCISEARHVKHHGIVECEHHSNGNAEVS